MRQLTIAFLGQCQVLGYPGVPPDAVFPQICRRAIEAQRPEVQVDVAIVNYQHPLELPDKTAEALRASPRVVVIEAVGWMAIKGREAIDLSRLPRGVRTAVQRVRHLQVVAGRLAMQVPGGELIYNVQHNSTHWSSSKLLRGLMPRYPRPSMEQYAYGLEDALRQIDAVGAKAVVQGPGAPNLDLESGRLAPDAMEKYRSVEQLARRAAEQHGALYVDRWDTVSPGFFLPGHIRPSAKGHTLWGNLLAEKLLEHGLV